MNRQIRLTRSRFLRGAAAILSLVGISAMVGAIARQPAYAATGGPAEVVKLRGSALLIRGGARSNLTEGQVLQLDDVVMTAGEARLKIRFEDGSTLTLAEMSKLSLDRFVFDATAKSRDASVTLLEGVLQMVAAAAAPGARFEVSTGTAVAASRSTEWIVTATMGKTSVYVLEGEVDVSGRGLALRSLPTLRQEENIRVQPGESVTFGMMETSADTAKAKSDPTELAKLLALLGDQ